MEVANFAVGKILSWIRRWTELAAAGARNPPLTAVELPADMLHDILLRLAADEVCRMRLVCRSWRSVTSDPLFARAHASRHSVPHVIAVRHDKEAGSLHAVDLHGNTIKSMQIRQPISHLSMHGDLLCVSHGWRLTSVVDMVTGAVADVGVDHQKKVNSATPYCVLGHVPSTGEYKVLRIQADYCSRRRRQMCDVTTLGGGSDAGRWRRRTCPPFTLRIEPASSSRNVAVVAGLAYFLVCWGPGEKRPPQADRIAVFDLATEEWKPATIKGPVSSSTENVEEDEDDELDLYVLRFQLARLGNNLVVVECNIPDCSTELWFLEDMDDMLAPHWSRRYTLCCTPFVLDGPVTMYTSFMYCFTIQQCHYPLAVLDDGRILAWVDTTSALRAYDPETRAWNDLAKLTSDFVVGMHHGNLLC